MPLRIKVRRGETIIIEGVPLRFHTSAEIDFVRQTDFLPGRRTLSAADATTWSSRLYFAIQEAYVQPRTDRAVHLGQLLAFLDQLGAAIRERRTDSISADILNEVRQLVFAGEYFSALKITSAAIEREDPGFWAAKRQRDRDREREAEESAFGQPAPSGTPGA